MLLLRYQLEAKNFIQEELLKKIIDGVEYTHIFLQNKKFILKREIYFLILKNHITSTMFMLMISSKGNNRKYCIFEYEIT